MVDSRIISVRKLGTPLPPMIVKVRAYPTSIDEILTREIAAQQLRALRMLRGRVYQLINNYLDGKISEEELKREYIRYVKQIKDVTYTTIALIDFSHLIEDLENAINLIEKTINYICFNKNRIDNFNKILVKNIVDRNLAKILNYRKSVSLIRTFVNEKIIELQATIETLSERLKKYRRLNVVQRLDEVAAVYLQYRWASRELLAVQLSMNLGLTDIYDELLRLVNLSSERETLETQLRMGEIDKTEYSRRIQEIRERVVNYRSSILGKVDKYKRLRETISNNEEYLRDFIGEKSYNRLKRILIYSEKSLEKIHKILEEIERNETDLLRENIS